MSMVAIFSTGCCERELVLGRFAGNEMAPPSLERCPFGCEPRFMAGHTLRIHLRFVTYQGEEFLSAELRAAWRFPDRNTDLWTRYRSGAVTPPAKHSTRRVAK